MEFSIQLDNADIQKKGAGVVGETEMEVLHQGTNNMEKIEQKKEDKRQVSRCQGNRWQVGAHRKNSLHARNCKSH